MPLESSLDGVGGLEDAMTTDCLLCVVERGNKTMCANLGFDSTCTCTSSSVYNTHMIKYVVVVVVVVVRGSVIYVASTTAAAVISTTATVTNKYTQNGCLLSTLSTFGARLMHTTRNASRWILSSRIPSSEPWLPDQWMLLFVDSHGGWVSQLFDCCSCMFKTAHTKDVSPNHQPTQMLSHDILQDLPHQSVVSQLRQLHIISSIRELCSVLALPYQFDSLGIELLELFFEERVDLDANLADIDKIRWIQVFQQLDIMTQPSNSNRAIATISKQSNRADPPHCNIPPEQPRH
jgi:hypothetical protein